MKTGSAWFLWLARLFLLASAMASFILAFFPSLHRFHYVDAELATSRIDPGIAVIFTLPLIIGAGLAWWRPRAGGLFSVIYSLAVLITWPLKGYTVIFFPLWGGFLLGSVMHVFIPEEAEISAIAEERLRRSAIVVSFLSPLCYALIFLLVFVIRLPAGLGAGLFYTPWAILIAVIAILRPSIGGPLLVFAGGLLFSASLMTDHYPEYYLPVSGFSIIGGILHLIARY